YSCIIPVVLGLFRCLRRSQSSPPMHQIRRSVWEMHCCSGCPSPQELLRLSLTPLEDRQSVVAVHLGDEAEADFLRTHRLAGTGNGAVAETFLVHLLHHVEHAAVLFGFALRE